jgi:dihydropteroate synthase
MPVLVMGVLNVTPDSFSDGGRWLSHAAAIEHGLEMAAQGADIVDVGGESTRPGAVPVSIDEELERIVPVVETLSREVRVSIDTMKPEVADAALRSGATIVNDVSASLYEVAARHSAVWVAMHMQGEPRTMQTDPMYEDVVAEVATYLDERAEKALAAGVGEVWIDPGIGFGKTLQHNLSLIRHLDRLTAMPYPVVLGTSRKSFLGMLAGTPNEPTPPEERLEGSLATVVVGIEKGVSVVRVHDVKETVRVARVVSAIEEAA